MLQFITAFTTTTWSRAFYSSIEALTVLFLTIGFFAIAASVVVSIAGYASILDLLLSLLENGLVITVIVATKTNTFRSTHFTNWKTFAVHFYAICLFASTTILLLFWSSLHIIPHFEQGHTHRILVRLFLQLIVSRLKVLWFFKADQG